MWSEGGRSNILVRKVCGGGRDTDVQVRSGQFRAVKLIHQSKTGTAKGSEGTNMSH